MHRDVSCPCTFNFKSHFEVLEHNENNVTEDSEIQNYKKVKVADSRNRQTWEKLILFSIIIPSIYS